MPRYLVRKKGRVIDYIPVPSGVNIQKTNGGYKVKGGVLHKGYKMVTAASKAEAVKKAIGKK